MTPASFGTGPPEPTATPGVPVTISLTSTLKTSVYSTTDGDPNLIFPTQPGQGLFPSNSLPASMPAQATSHAGPTPHPTGSPGGGNPGNGNPGGSGGGGQISIPGLGAIVTSALAANPTPNPGDDGAGDRGSGIGGVIASIWQNHGGAGSGGSGGSSGGSAPGNPGAIVNNVPVGPGQSGEIVIGGSTYQAAPTSRIVTANGQTFTILPSNGGVVAPGGMTIPASAPIITPGPSFILGSQPVSINPSNPSQVVVDGSTINIPSSGSTVFAISGTTFTLGPSAIIEGTSTIALAVPTAPPTFTAETVDGIPFDIGSTLAIINGQTVTIGPGATLTTLTIGSETITAGPDGLIFPGTTVEPLPTTEVVDGITFGLQPSDVVISGTTYPFDHPTTLVLGPETIVIGTGGVIVEGSTTMTLEGFTTTIAAPSLTQGVSKVSATAKATTTTGAATHFPVQAYGGLLGVLVAVVGLL